MLAYLTNTLYPIIFMGDDYIVIFVTCKNKEEAENIAESLVLEKLAACVNIIPTITSIYFWEDKLCSESEALLIIKTQGKLFKRLEKRVKQLHSYKVPEIISFPITSGSADYLDWLHEATKGSTRVGLD